MEFAYCTLSTQELNKISLVLHKLISKDDVIKLAKYLSLLGYKKYTLWATKHHAFFSVFDYYDKLLIIFHTLQIIEDVLRQDDYARNSNDFSLLKSIKATDYETASKHLAQFAVNAQDNVGETELLWLFENICDNPFY